MDFLMFMFAYTFIGMLGCYYIAKKRGANPVFWAVMGAFVGAIAIPLALIYPVKKKKDY